MRRHPSAVGRLERCHGGSRDVGATVHELNTDEHSELLDTEGRLYDRGGVGRYVPFLRETLECHPRLRATRLLEMIRQRGYTSSIQRLLCMVAAAASRGEEALFLRLVSMPGEQAQVDCAHFGEVVWGRARRRLSCFVMTFSFSPAFFLEFSFDQSQERHRGRERSHRGEHGSVAATTGRAATLWSVASAPGESNDTAGPG